MLSLTGSGTCHARLNFVRFLTPTTPSSPTISPTSPPSSNSTPSLHSIYSPKATIRSLKSSPRSIWRRCESRWFVARQASFTRSMCSLSEVSVVDPSSVPFHLMESGKCRGTCSFVWHKHLAPPRSRPPGAALLLGSPPCGKDM